MAASKDSKVAMPAWHPNFRIAETLPDTKVIRTSFLVNAAAAMVLLGLGALLTTHELELRKLGKEIDDLTARKEALSVKHRAAIPVQLQFAEVERRFSEVENFRKNSWPATRLLERLSLTLPRMVRIASFDVQGDLITLRGEIVGAPEQAATIFNEYLETLAQDPELKTVVKDVRQSTVKRDARTNFLSFTIEMNLNKAK